VRLDCKRNCVTSARRTHRTCASCTILFLIVAVLSVYPLLQMGRCIAKFHESARSNRTQGAKPVRHFSSSPPRWMTYRWCDKTSRIENLFFECWLDFAMLLQTIYFVSQLVPHDLSPDCGTFLFYSHPRTVSGRSGFCQRSVCNCSDLTIRDFLKAIALTHDKFSISVQCTLCFCRVSAATHWV
jgi:hypothetical protein